MNKPYLLFRNHNSPYWYAQIRLADGSRRKYKKSDVLAFVEYLQKSV